MGDYLFRCSASMATIGTERKTKVVFFAQKLGSRKIEDDFNIPFLHQNPIPILVMDATSSDYSTMDTDRKIALNAIALMSKFKFLTFGDVNIFSQWGHISHKEHLIKKHNESLENKEKNNDILDFSNQHIDIRDFKTQEILTKFNQYVEQNPIDSISDEIIQTALWGIMHDLAERSAYTLIDGEVWKIQASVYLRTVISKLQSLPLLKDSHTFLGEKEYTENIFNQLKKTNPNYGNSWVEAFIRLWGINTPTSHNGIAYGSLKALLEGHHIKNTKDAQYVINQHMKQLFHMQYLYDLGIPFYRIEAAGQDYDNLEQQEMLNSMAFMRT